MSEHDKPYSIQDCENWLAAGSETEDGKLTDRFVRQLLDTMRENERMRGLLKSRGVIVEADHIIFLDETSREMFDRPYEHSEPRNYFQDTPKSTCEHEWERVTDDDSGSLDRCKKCGSMAGFNFRTKTTEGK